MATRVVEQEVLYIQESGIIESDMFGCAFKSVSAETGFNGAPSTIDVTVLERNPGDFTLNRNSIGDMQVIKIGELRMTGFVESYERTTISRSGSGIYSVKIKDSRVVMQTAMIANLGTAPSTSRIGAPNNSREAVRYNVISVSGTPSGSRASGVNREEITGLPLDGIIETLEGNVLYYGGRQFELDLSEFSELVDSSGDGPSEYLIQGKTRSLVSILNEFTSKAGASWWIDTRKKGVSDDLWVISIRTTDRDANRARDITDVTLDTLAELHSGEIISRKDGFERNHSLRRKFVFGGVIRSLEFISDLEEELVHNGQGNYKVKPVLQRRSGQFWGFDAEGIPLLNPAFTTPSSPDTSIPTNVEEMEDALNGSLNGEEDLERLRSLKRYMNTHWGRQFWYRVDDRVEIVPNAWWETVNIPVPFNKREDFPNEYATGGMVSDYPNGTTKFSNSNMLKLSTEDGRYVPFVQINEFSVSSGSIEYKDNGTPYREFKNHFINWTPIVSRSHHLIYDTDVFDDPRKYMRCSLTQFDRYIIITLPVPMSKYVVNADTGEIDYTRITRHNKLDHLWLPSMDRSVHYGPWTDGGNIESRRLAEIAAAKPVGGYTPSQVAEMTSLRERAGFINGRVLSNIDRDLVPWAFGGRGITDEVASADMEAEGIKKADFKAQERVFLTGQLEVAGLPAVDLSQPISTTFGGGSFTNITEIYIRADENGITTRYTVAINSRTRSGNDPPQNELQQIQEEREILQDDEDEFPELLDDLKPLEDDLLTSDTDIEEELLDAVTDPEDPPTGPTSGSLEFIYDKPDGGLGVISVKEGGPFYAVRRLDYQDIDPQTYAGGFDTTGSYFLAEWTGVRNLAEPANSPGLLTVGTRVTISIFSQEGLDGPYVPYMEQTPQVFSPPPVS